MVNLLEKPRLRPVGDRGLLIEYGDAIDPEINLKVRVMALALEQARPPGLIEVIPTYRSLLVIYDPLNTDMTRLECALETLEGQLEQLQIPQPRVVEIPVCYGDEFGPDMEFVASFHGLTEDDVVRLHTSPTYQIYMIGFTPGFPYLGGLPAELHTPRLESPRPLVKPGSVGIANNQTGIYPVESPGGWRIIGRTPLRLFDPTSEQPFLYVAGDFIRFVPISREGYEQIASANTRSQP